MMEVEQCVITGDPEVGPFEITGRVWLDCELTGEADGAFVEVRLLEAGAGLPVGATLYVHGSKVRET